MAADEILLDVRHLSVTFAGGVRAVRGVSFQVRPGEVLALVGESGSGKSTSGLAVMGLVDRDRGAEITGEIRLRGKDGAEREIISLPENELRQLRGNDVAMIFQEPMSSLNPIYSIGTQICEAIRIHRPATRAEAACDAREALDLLAIPNPDRCMASYPHQLSGGMRQRVMIAMALACHPALLIADEPTTALDVTIQAQIIEHLKRLQRQTGMAVLFITHNLGLVAEIADRAMVMYAGEIVESGSVADIFGAPRMPYTQALLKSLPRLNVTRASGTRIEAIPGSVPSAGRWPAGCAFHPRCRHVVAGRCDISESMLEACDTGRHRVRCLRWRELEVVP